MKISYAARNANFPTNTWPISRYSWKRNHIRHQKLVEVNQRYVSEIYYDDKYVLNDGAESTMKRDNDFMTEMDKVPWKTQKTYDK